METGLDCFSQNVIFSYSGKTSNEDQVVTVQIQPPPQHISLSLTHQYLFHTGHSVFFQNKSLSLRYLTGFQRVKYFCDIVQDLQLAQGEIWPSC